MTVKFYFIVYFVLPMFAVWYFTEVHSHRRAFLDVKVLFDTYVVLISQRGNVNCIFVVLTA